MPVLIRETQVTERRWLWVIGCLYALGLVWLLPVQPVQFASPRMQMAGEMCILYCLPLLLLSRARRITSRAVRVTVTIIVCVVFAVTLLFAYFACTEYMTYMHTDGPLTPLPDGYRSLSHQPILTFSTRDGVIRVIRYNRKFVTDVMYVTVYLDRPVIPGIVHRVLLAGGENADTAMVRLVGPDMVEITFRRWNVNPPLFRVVRRHLSPH